MTIYMSLEYIIPVFGFYFIYYENERKILINNIFDNNFSISYAHINIIPYQNINCRRYYEIIITKISVLCVYMTECLMPISKFQLYIDTCCSVLI